MAISIVIPTYNRAEILGKTLDSIMNQTSTEWECLVVDDFSNDNTKEVVEKYTKMNNRISYLSNSHKKGAQGARNTGLIYAKYDWVICFDSDNYMHPDFVETMTRCLSDNFDVLACCADIIDVEKGRTGRIMNPNCHGNVHNALFCGKTYIDFNQAIIRKSKLNEIGYLDEDCPSMQEWDTHIRLSKTSRYTMINNCLVDYFMGGKDTITSNPKREVIGRLYILKKHLNEWKSRQIGLTKFSYQINCLIRTNNDDNFVKEKMKELKQLVPFLYVRVAICALGMGISRIIK